MWMTRLHNMQMEYKLFYNPHRGIDSSTRYVCNIKQAIMKLSTKPFLKDWNWLNQWKLNQYSF